MLKYIATPNRITFHYNGLTTTLCRKENAYFDQLYDAVKSKETNLEDYLPEYLTNPDAIAERTNGRLTYENGKLTSMYLDVPSSVSNLVRSFLDKQLPINPIASFLENLSYNPSPSIQKELGEYLTQGKVPLTWDGGMICYARSSWIHKDNVMDWMENGFQSGQHVQGSELPCGTFEWATGHCPDQGRIYDLFVMPQHVQALSKEKLAVKEYINVSELEETKDPEQIHFIKTRLSSLGETVYVREPFSTAALSSYVASTLTSKNAEVQQIQQSVGVAL